MPAQIIPRYPDLGLTFVAPTARPVSRVKDLLFFITAGSREEFRIDDQYDVFRRKTMALGALQSNWDTYGGTAPSNVAIATAVQVLDCLQTMDESFVKLDWVAPTVDGSVLLEYRANGTIHRWEFESDGDIAVMKKLDEGDPTYVDVNIADIGNVLRGLIYAEADQ